MANEPIQDSGAIAGRNVFAELSFFMERIDPCCRPQELIARTARSTDIQEADNQPPAVRNDNSFGTGVMWSKGTGLRTPQHRIRITLMKSSRYERLIVDITIKTVPPTQLRLVFSNADCSVGVRP